MPVITGRDCSRREALRRLGAGALLAAGAWPGHALGKEGDHFRFVVVNDLHYIDGECGKWLSGVMTRIKTEQPDFCLVAGDLTEHGKEEHLRGVREVLEQAIACTPVLYVVPDDRSIARVEIDSLFAEPRLVRTAPASAPRVREEAG